MVIFVKYFALAAFLIVFLTDLYFAIIAVGLIAFVKIKFDVNLIDVISQVKTLTEEVDANNAYKKQVAAEDLESTKLSINTSFNTEVVTNSEAEGYKIADEITNNSHL